MIAIIGVGCLFPGAATPDEFWQVLREGRDTTSQASLPQMGIDPARLFHPQKGNPDSTYNLRGGYIQGFQFEPQGYHLPADLLAQLDPTFQWSLYAARAALADSGYLHHERALARTGLLLGSLSFPTRASSQLLAPQYTAAMQPVLAELLGTPDLQLTGHPHTGYPIGSHPANLLIPGMPAHIVAAGLGLGGTRLVLDAACATSLYALALACEHLQQGTADLMLAGAVSCPDPLYMHLGFSIFQAYPTTSEHSRPLDRTSRGLYSAEGAGVVVLKRYRDALRDGDRIYGVVRGYGLSNDGSGKHPLMPNPKGQLLAFERAYQQSQIDPRTVEYVECHATGTPLGDTTEINSLEQFFGQHGHAPRIGSVKANMGHLLTAAGMGSLLKVLLAMQHGLLPATPFVQEPIASRNGGIPADAIVREPTPWQASTHPRRAGIDAFGFGGVNAHVIIDEHGVAAPTATYAPAAPPKLPSLAITGMAAHFGQYATLDALAAALYAGEQAFCPLPATRWKGLAPADSAPQGAWLAGFEFDFRRFRLPPLPADQVIPQHLLLLQVADAAIRDAGLVASGNVAVLVAMGTEMSLHQFRGRVDLGWQIEQSLAASGIVLSDAERARLTTLARDSLHLYPQVNQYTSFIGNVIASRVAAHHDFTGPAFTVSGEDASVLHALELARLLLHSDPTLEAVVLGAVDLTGGLERLHTLRQLAPLNSGTPSLSIATDSAGWLPGEGAGAVVLRRLPDAAGARVYACIEGLASVQHPHPDPAALQQAMHAAHAQAGSTPADVGYIELCASGNPTSDTAEAVAVVQSLPRTAAAPPTTALGSITASIGYTGAASGIASLIHATLALHERYIPATPGWHAPQPLADWQQSGLYVADAVRPWFVSQGRRRCAALNLITPDGTHAHLVLREAPQPLPSRRVLAQLAPTLMPLAAADQAGLVAALDQIEAALNSSASLPQIAHAAYTRWQAQRTLPYTAALVASTPAELRRELARARAGIPEALACGSEWKTPTGSYFTAQPQGSDGKVAFVYPGAFNAYVGLGQHLFTMFPELHEQLYQMVSDPGAMLGEHWLYPRSMQRLDSAALKAHEARMLSESIAMLEIGSSIGAAYTHLLRHVFRLQPDLVFGYSQGETAMFQALGVWRDGDACSAALRGSELYRSRLAGRKQAVRDYWGAATAGVADDDLWANYILMAGADAVLPHLADEPHVYLAIITAPREVMISGDPAGCQRVIRKVGCRSLRTPFSQVIHSPPIASEYDEFVRINSFPVEQLPGITFYSAATYAPINITSESVAHSSAQVFCNQLNFPRLVEQVYTDGARVFIELGAARTCSRWIEAILGNRPHTALAINKRGTDDQIGVVRLLAQLLSHGVALDLAPLYSDTPPAAPARGGLLRYVPTGGTPIGERIAAADAAAFQPQRTPPQPAAPASNGHHPLTPEPSETFAIYAPMAATALQDEEPMVMQPDNVVYASSNDAHALHLLYQQTVQDSAALETRAHATLLEARQAAFAQLETLVRNYFTTVQPASGNGTPPALPAAPAPEPAPAASEPVYTPIPFTPRYSTPSNVVWNEADLLEFAEGHIAKVFGDEYAIIDDYARRVRLPAPPYLLVSRVTHIAGTRGEYKPCSITTEYDIPQDAWYSVDRQIPWAVAVESGQCDLLLISYLGIDFEAQGNRVYRLLDCTLTFMDNLPQEGETLRYDIDINSFVRSGDALLFFFSYDCYVGDRLVLRMTDGCAGFFTDEELAHGRGVILSPKERAARAQVQPQHFAAPLHCSRTSFSYDDLLALSRGDIAAAFGQPYEQHGRNRSLRLPPRALLMIDRVVSVQAQGGLWGLGLVEAVKDLDAAHWYFPCHFPDDQVLAGSLMAEACGQLLQFFMLYLGLQTHTSNARFQPVPRQPQVVRCRGQVTPADSHLIYRLEVTEIGLEPHPYALGNVDVIVGERVVVNFSGLGLQLVDQAEPAPPPPAALPASIPAPAAPPRPAVVSEAQIREFTLGRVSACLGDEYRVFEEQGRRMPRIPNSELQVLSRVVQFEGTRNEFAPGTLLVAEYDVPPHAWYFVQNSYPVLPYSILMEIALQPCGFLAAYLGSALLLPDADLYFRNLDGSGTLHALPDVRGKTITNHARLVSSTFIQGIIIQKYTYACSVDGQVFYEGDAVFGYFTPDALANQVGLDSGKETQPWHQQHPGTPTTMLNLHSDSTRQRLFAAPTDKPHYRVPAASFDLLDQVLVVPQGGKHGQGYIYASKRTDPRAWFFRCHFHEDPVMPGSLGVEAVLEAMQAFVVQQGVGQQFRNPAISMLPQHRVVWKYRGQIVREVPQWSLEVHISRIEQRGDSVVVIGDASVWRGGLRIYEIRDLAVRVCEAGQIFG